MNLVTSTKKSSECVTTNKNSYLKLANNQREFTRVLSASTQNSPESASISGGRAVIYPLKRVLWLEVQIFSIKVVAVDIAATTRTLNNVRRGCARVEVNVVAMATCRLRIVVVLLAVLSLHQFIAFHTDRHLAAIRGHGVRCQLYTCIKTVT